MSEKIIIGVAGRLASGKGSVGKYLIEHYAAARFRSSDPLRQAVDIFGAPQSRDNLSNLSTFLRQQCGENVIAKSVERLITQSPNPICVYDGMRRVIDVTVFRALPNFTLVYMDTDVVKRYGRYIKRNENTGDAEMSYSDFLIRDNLEPEQQLDQLRDQADIIIDNNGVMEDLDRQITDVITKLLDKKLT